MSSSRSKCHREMTPEAVAHKNRIREERRVAVEQMMNERRARRHR